MEVQMRHTLSRLLTLIGDNAEALKSELLCKAGYGFKGIRHKGAVFGGDFSFGMTRKWVGA